MTGITLVGDMTGVTRRHIPSTWADAHGWSNFMRGGVPVWFHKIHIVNAPWLFEAVYAVFRPFLSEHARGNVVVHKRSGGRAELFKEVGGSTAEKEMCQTAGIFFRCLIGQVDRDILPEELGGAAGPIDNSSFLEEVLGMDDYFRELAKSSRARGKP